MKTRFTILLALAAALSFYSCEKVGPEKHLSDANLFVDLVIKSSADTKTSGDDEIDPTEKEGKISSVQLFLVAWDATNSKPASNTAVIKVSDAEVIDSTSVGASITMSSGKYLLYVIANCPTELTLDLDSYEDFIGSYGKDATSITNVNGTITDVTKIWKDDNFMMVNSVDGNTGTGCYNGGVLVDFSQQTISATVALERVSAKIVADQDKLIDFSASMQKVLGPYDTTTSEYVDYVISSAKIDAWALMNCVNSFNLIQKYTADTKDFHVANASDDPMNVIVTPSSDGTKYPVAKKTTDSETNLKSVGYYYTNPQYTGYNTTEKKPEYTELVFVDAGETLYCLENNPPYCPEGDYQKSDGTYATPAVSDSKMKGRATAVVFRAQILLADGFDADAYTGSHNGTDPVGKDNNPGTWDEKPTKAYSTDLVKTIYEYKGKYYADADRLKTDYSSALSSCTDDAALRAAGVKVYENGYMYYTYYISKTEMPGCHSPYYCVERNKCYKLTVKSVSGLGDDLPCDYPHYDPEDPIDMAIPRIKVTADVLPWNVKETVTYEIQ